MGEYSYPTEAIDLPSGGKLYPKDSPLAAGTIDVKYMTAKEEDILTSTNLIQKGLVLDRLMDSLIVTRGVKTDDLLIGDLNAVMVASRILAYGKDYPIQVTCTSCDAKFDHVVDLSLLETVGPADHIVDGEYKLTLPTGMDITFRLLTRGDERLIKGEVDAMKKFNNSVDTDASTRLKYTITSVGGNRDNKFIREFADSMIVRDVRALRQEVKKVSPDVNFDLVVNCSECGEEIKVRMPFGANFFWPDSGV